MRIIVAAFLSALLASAAVAADSKKIVLLAGIPSHGVGEHEHRAGMMLLQKSLAGYPGVTVEVRSINSGGNRWVDDESIFDDAAAVVIYADGAGGHPYLRDDHLAKIGALAAKGVGIGMIHYATEPTIENGQKEFIAWTGGAFEVNRSVNPIFLGEFKSLPQHAVTRGVHPFKTTDEWYFHIRFRDGMSGVTPILSLIAPASSMNRPDAPRLGLREGNESVWAAVKAKEPQHVMWVTERADGGRGFGFTGGHYHANWANDDQRKLVLNALLWVAKIEVPANGVVSKVTIADLRANLDPKGGRGGGAVTAQTTAISSLNALVSMNLAVVSDARRALNNAAFALPRDMDAIRVRARELADADLELANARAEVLANIQSSADKLDSAQIEALATAAAAR